MVEPTLPKAMKTKRPAAPAEIVSEAVVAVAVAAAAVSVSAVAARFTLQNLEVAKRLACQRPLRKPNLRLYAQVPVPCHNQTKSQKDLGAPLYAVQLYSIPLPICDGLVQ